MNFRSGFPLFASIFLVFSSIWFLFLGWNGTALLCGNDSLLESLVYRELLNAHGHWQNILYNPALLGGTLFHGLFGSSLLSQFFALLELPENWAYNLSHLLIQSSFAYFGLLIVRELSHRRKGKPEFSWWWTWTVIILIGFQPSLGWRLGWGHQNFLSGLLVPLALFYFAVRSSTSIFNLILVWAVLVQGLSSLGQQLILYSLFFFTPFFLALNWGYGRKTWKANFLVLLSALFLVIPQNLEFLRVALSGDSRSAMGTDVVYSYLTGTWNDLLTFFFSSPILASTRDNPFIFHEAHYFLGPYILGLWALRKEKKTLSCFLGGLVFVLVLAINLKPFSSWILSVLPLLSGLRTPLRGFLILSLLLTLLSLGELSSRFPNFAEEDKIKKIFFPAIGVSIGLFLEAWPFEVYIYILVLALLYILYRRKFQSLLPAICISLAALSLISFQRVLTPGLPDSIVISETRAQRDQLLKTNPELRSPLTRVSLKNNFFKYNNNSAWAISASSLNGYFSAPSRFAKLFAESVGIEYNPSISNVQILESSKDFPVFQQLYNICCSVMINGAQQIHEKLPPTNGEAWFGNHLLATENVRDLMNELRLKGFKKEKYRSLIYIKEASSSALPETIEEDCSAAKIQSVQANKLSTNLVDIQMQTPADCPLVIAMNYSSELKVIGDSQELLRTFPVFGSLLGVWIPKGTSYIKVNLEPLFPVWAYGISLLLSALALFAGIWILKNEK